MTAIILSRFSFARLVFEPWTSPIRREWGTAPTSA